MQALCFQVAFQPGVASNAASASRLPRQWASAPPQLQSTSSAVLSGRRRGALQVLSAKKDKEQDAKARSDAAEKPKARGFGPKTVASAGSATVVDSSTANSGIAAPGGGYWTEMKVNIDELKERPADKPGKPVILANKKNVCLFLYKGKVFATAGNGTAFEYPLFDSELFDGPGGKPALRCKFDRTSYDLETGAVIEWCPKDESPISVLNMLSTLKKVADPVNLKVFPTRVQKDGGIEILYSM